MLTWIVTALFLLLVIALIAAFLLQWDYRRQHRSRLY